MTTTHDNGIHTTGYTQRYTDFPSPLALSPAVYRRAAQIAAEIAANPAPQLRMIKSLLTDNAVESDLRLVQRREHELIRECWRSPEHHRAVDAFLARSR